MAVTTDDCKFMHDLYTAEIYLFCH